MLMAERFLYPVLKYRSYGKWDGKVKSFEGGRGSV